MSIAAALHDYLQGYAPLTEERLDIDFLGADAGAFSLEVTDGGEWVRRYIDGSGEKTLRFVLAHRAGFDQSLAGQAGPLAFYEDFAAWLDNQTEHGSLPDLGETRTAVKLESLSGGYVLSQGTHTARYQIQCQLTYIQEREN